MVSSKNLKFFSDSQSFKFDLWIIWFINCGKLNKRTYSLNEDTRKWRVRPTGNHVLKSGGIKLVAYLAYIFCKN